MSRPFQRRPRLSREQVREIRLSMLGPEELGKVFGLHPKSIGNIRNGQNYGTLRRDEAAAHRKRLARGLRPPPSRDTLLVSSMFPILGRLDLSERFDRVRLLDAENECPHGRLPGDPTPPCGCWVQERPVLVVIPGQLNIYDFDLEAA